MERKVAVSQHWEKYWESNRKIADWDYTSQMVYSVLQHEINRFEGLKIAEIGCGTGRISLKMALKKASISVIDISKKAIKNTLEIFRQTGLDLKYAIGSIFAIPLNENSHDVVWNAGVLEHFSESEMEDAISEMTKICAPEGYVIILTPYQGSIFYRFGKFILELLNQWSFGHEDPIKTLNKFNKKGEIYLVKEYSVGFFLIFVEAFKFFKYTNFITLILRRIFISIHQSKLGNSLWWLDRKLSDLLGGYLLVSVFQCLKTS